jgi:hypothetical protein
MINLSVQDRVDGKGKVAELVAAIGQSFYDNHSSTGRSVLVGVSADGNVCDVKEVANRDRKPKVGVKKSPSWLIWNSMFY